MIYMSSSTRTPVLSQKGLNSKIPVEIRNVIKTKNVDALRNDIHRLERQATSRFASGRLNTRDLDRMFNDLSVKVDKLETDMVKEAVKILPMKKGGMVKKTDLYLLHKGEKVVTKKEVDKNRKNSSKK
jgi:hypothetical protein